MATHSSILAWKISWTEEPGGLQFVGSQRVGHDWVTNTNLTDEDSPSWFKRSLKAQPPNTITFEGQDFNIWIWGGHTHLDYSKNQPQLGTSCIINILASTLKVKVLVAQSCPALCESMDYSPPGSSVHGILQARILEWVAIPFSRRSSQASNQTQVCLSHQGFLPQH